MFKRLRPKSLDKKGSIFIRIKAEKRLLVRINFIRLRTKLYIASSLKIKVFLAEGERAIAFFNTGAKINVITEKLAIETRLAVRPRPNLVLMTHTRNTKEFVKVYKNVKVSIKEVVII